jgi:hypothetical protein
MARPCHSSVHLGDLPHDLYDYARPPHRRVGRPPKTDPATWTVTDDWPARVPVTVAEVELFEAWSSDLFDSLLGPRP